MFEPGMKLKKVSLPWWKICKGASASFDTAAGAGLSGEGAGDAPPSRDVKEVGSRTRSKEEDLQEIQGEGMMEDPERDN